MGYKYFICDVFTKERFTGNQLAVVPEASGLSSKQMQAIAHEFNFSETVFIMPPENFKTRKLKIYTPTVEVPFAGHPNIGAAFILAKAGYLGNIKPPVQLTFEEKAGEVDVEIKTDSDGAIYCEVAAPQPLSISNTINTNLIASVLTIDNSEIVTTTHEPVVASDAYTNFCPSCGVPGHLWARSPSRRPWHPEQGLLCLRIADLGPPLFPSPLST